MNVRQALVDSAHEEPRKTSTTCKREVLIIWGNLCFRAPQSFEDFSNDMNSIKTDEESWGKANGNYSFATRSRLNLASVVEMWAPSTSSLQRCAAEAEYNDSSLKCNLYWAKLSLKTRDCFFEYKAFSVSRCYRQRAHSRTAQAESSSRSSHEAYAGLRRLKMAKKHFHAAEQVCFMVAYFGDGMPANIIRVSVSEFQIRGLLKLGLLT